MTTPDPNHVAPDRVLIFDTTLRDGEQSPGCSLNLEEKVRMARQLELLRVDVIEAGFPIASVGDFEAVHLIARTLEYCTVAALCRTVKRDIDRAWEAIQYAKKPRIHTFIATSDIHLAHKLKKTRQQAFVIAKKWRKGRKNTEPGASPNGGPTQRLGNSGASGGPPSVS